MIIEFIKEFWGLVVGAIGVVTLLWGFFKVLKEIKTEVTKPITNINTKIDNLSKKIDAAEESDKQVRRALLTMQRSSLLKDCEDFIKRGFATMNEKDTISSQYDSYHELGGDNFITDLVSTVKDLPLEKQKVTRTKNAN